MVSATLTLQSNKKNVAVNVSQCSSHLRAFARHRASSVVHHDTDLFFVLLQLLCIPPRAKLITVGLPVSSKAIPFLTAAKIIRKSLRLDRECCCMS
jgi:hypothetical protein